MKTSYDLSFLTSPRDPRFDNWIGQPFVLSYLNSEPGTNYVMAYRPFGINDSRIDRERRFAERNIQQNVRIGEDPQFFDRRHHKANTHFEMTNLWGIRPSLEAIIKHNFIARLQESIAIIEVIDLFDVIQIPVDVRSDYVQASRYIEEKYINPVVSRLDIFGHRIEEIKDTILHLYKEYNRVIEHDNTYLTTLQLLERANFEQDVIEIGKLIISRMNTFNTGIIGLQQLAYRPNEQMSEFLAGPTIVDKEIKDTVLPEFKWAVRPDLTGIETGELLAGHRIESTQEATLAIYTTAITESRFGIPTELVKKGEMPDIEAVIYEPLVALEKHHNNYGVVYTMQLVDPHISKESLIVDTIIKTYGVSVKESYIETQFALADYGPRDVLVNTFNMFDRNIDSNKEVLLTDYVLLDRGGRAAIERTEDIDYATWFPAEATVEQVLTNFEIRENEARNDGERLIGDYFKKDAKSSMEFMDLVLIDRLQKDSLKDFYNVRADERVRKDAKVDDKGILLEVINVHHAFIQENDWTLANFVELDARIVNDGYLRTDLMPQDSWIGDLQKYVDPEGFKSFEGRIDVIDKLVSLVPLEGHNLEVYEKRVSKIDKEAWLQYILKSLSSVEKAGIIRDHWDTFAKISRDAMDLEMAVHQKIGLLMEKEAKSSDIEHNVDLAKKEAKDILIVEQLMADPTSLNGYLKDLMGIAEGPSEFDAIVAKLVNAAGEDREGLVSEHPIYGNEPINQAIIHELINANDKNNGQRDAWIVEPQYKLIGDQSEWEDIWNRYSPGVDILDPPDSDYDYQKLAEKVYNPNTGVPYKPLSPTNVPEVKVKTPLHHPLPQHFDIGVDDTKQIIVDNYTFIDVTLAIESIKNRNKLRYAGMPGEKTVRELFSQLFTWINQAAPGNPEYSRMFRFARWYAESAVLSLSKHILVRVYNAWKSSFHNGGDLGIPYTQTGWQYFPTAYVTQTISTHSEYKFESENYVDGEFILRGYFDNPLSQGTMEIRVDGSLVDTVSVNGAFTRTIPVEQGKHTYELIFDGQTGRVSLSTIEITGSVFVSAHTVSDDSDTNGLKVITTLINMLLTYFEKHHGGRKIKGTMEVKQRKLWQSQ